MSYNIVKKGESTVLVKKFRDGEGKVRENYITSFGVMTDEEFKDFRKQVHELSQETRIAFCMRSGRVKEVPTDVLRKKAPTGDIREPTIKKEKRVRKKAKEVEKEIVDDRPAKQVVVIKMPKAEGMDVSRIRTIGKKKEAINNRIQAIKDRINLAKQIITQKKTVQTFTKTERESVHRDIEYHQSVIESGNKAIGILKKQRSRLR